MLGETFGVEFLGATQEPLKRRSSCPKTVGHRFSQDAHTMFQLCCYIVPLLQAPFSMKTNGGVNEAPKKSIRGSGSKRLGLEPWTGIRMNLCFRVGGKTLHFNLNP